MTDEINGEDIPSYTSLPSEIDAKEVYRVVKSLEDKLPFSEMEIEEKILDFIEDSVPVSNAHEVLLRQSPQTSEELSDVRTEPPANYTHLEIQYAAEDISYQVALETAEVRDRLYNLTGYALHLEDAKDTILREAERTFAELEDYEKFDEWSSSSPPPNVEQWVVLDDNMSGNDIKERAKDMTYGSDFVVYCIECFPSDKPLRELQREAKIMLGEIPSWVEEGYRADHVFYIGQTSRFGQRLESQATGILSDSPPPAALVSLFGMRAVGIIGTPLSREEAKSLKQTYAENLEQVGHSHRDILVYHASGEYRK